MNRKDIGKIISKAIRKGKFVYISYVNKQNEETKYWIAVYDIYMEGDEPLLKCEMYNPSKNIDGTLISDRLSFNSIQSAIIIEFSNYDVPEALLKKLESYTGKYDWLEYDTDVRCLLNYYEQCNFYDKDPYQKKGYKMIRGIDYHVLRERKTYLLSKEQKEDVVMLCQKQLYQKENLKFCELALSRLSIDKDEKKYVVCYNNVNFDPKRGVLCLDDTLRFNKTFLHKRIFEDKISEEEKSSLFQYSEMNIDDFIELFKNNEREGEAIIESNLRPGESINNRPDLMLLERDVAIDLRKTYDAIVERDIKHDLNVPLKAFLGKITKKDKRRKEPEIIICDNKINVDQTRVLYNALSQPVTYVQGPPGTGKTQTILNVVLNAFYNKKTVLVCSSNNKPVDGIIEKLSMEYNGEKIPFPFLRMGNYDQVKIALERINELFQLKITHNPDDEKLKKIKSTTSFKNEKLNNILKRQQEYADALSYLKDAEKLQRIVVDQKSQFAYKVNETVAKLKNDILQKPEVRNQELDGLFTSLEDDHYLKQWMFYTSLKCILTLQKKDFAELRSICEIKEEKDKVVEFNRWLSDDTNMKKFVRAFPIIFTTNISSRRLGTPNFMFDLVIMDEAGQCNVAHSLIPITKADSLLLVGDPRQLKPIVVLEDSINSQLRKYNVISEDYDYKNNSILDIMQKHDTISQRVLLTYHYRCAKHIIDFSNKKYYNSALNLSSIKDNGELIYIPVENKNISGRNSFIDEAKEIVRYIKDNNLKDAMIVTPFVHQRDLLNSLLQEEGITEIECGTVHSMQGGEKQTIILSTALSLKTSQRTFEWLKNNAELINVAVTRAKKNLVVVSDDEAVSLLSKGEKSDLVDLIQYVKNNGVIEVPRSEVLKLDIAKSNGSNYENEFYKTISQFCSVHDSFEAKRNRPFSDIFADDEELRKDGSHFDCILYEKRLGRIYPKIAIEINGGEHFGDKKREEADNRKKRICEQKGLMFFVISNSFVKSYEQIRTIILNSREALDTQGSLFETLEYLESGFSEKVDSDNGGFCIRCGGSIGYNSEVPYCRSCYFSWKTSKISGYSSEKYCHSCGNNDVAICLNRPLCKSCFKESTSLI